MLNLNNIKYKNGAGIYNSLIDIVKQTKTNTPKYLYRLSIDTPLETTKPSPVILYRCGNMVLVIADLYYTYPLGTTIILPSIPAGYRPTVSYYDYPCIPNGQIAARSYMGGYIPGESTGKSVISVYNYGPTAINNMPIYMLGICLDETPKVWTSRFEIPQDGILFQ